MDINTVDSGSRVTRSLRKRLSSVDNDSSSRPTTPLSTKLTSITEISASPSKSTRSTRRSSVSGSATPIKTPAKRVVSSSVLVEDSETSFSTRNTRRRSVLTDENDETRQRNEHFSTNEEIVKDEEKQRRRLHSKPIFIPEPQQFRNLTKSNSPRKATILTSDKSKEIEVNAKSLPTKKRKPGPKSKTGIHEIPDGMSDVEITIVDDDISDLKNESPSVATVVLTDDDSNPMSNIQSKDFAEHKETDLINSFTSARTDVKSQNLNTDTPIEEQGSNISHKNIDQDTISEPSSDSKLEKVDNNEPNISTSCSENKHVETIGNHDTSGIVSQSSKECIEETNTLSQLENSNINMNSNASSDTCEKEDKVANDCLTSEGKSITENVDRTGLQEQKKVDFISSPANDTSAKIVYPKTPASTKNMVISKILRSSLEIHDLELNATNADAATNNDDLESCITTAPETECERISTLERSKTEGTTEKISIESESSPHKDIDKMLITSKAILATDSKEVQKKDEELRWINPSTTGITEVGSKLDTVSATANVSVENKGIAFSPDNEVEIQEEEEEEKENEEYEKEHDYIDGQAMEVNNYESGDSMTFSEREDIELNEVPIEEVSIGSHSTDDDEDAYAEEEEDIGSFIVSDNENIENAYEETDEYINETKHKANNKQYRRILSQNDSSSNSDDMEEKQPNTVPDINIENEQNKVVNSVPEEEDCQTKPSDSFSRTQSQNEISSSSDEMEEKKRKSSRESADGDGSDGVPDINLENEQNKILNCVPEEEGCQTKPSESFSDQNLSNKSCNSINLDSSKLSDSALRLQYAELSKSEEDERKVEEMNISRKEILSAHHHSLRLNKSVRDLNLEAYDKEELKNASSSSEKDILTENKMAEESITSNREDDNDNGNKSLNISTARKPGGGFNDYIGNCESQKEQIHSQESGDMEVILTDAKLEENGCNNFSSTRNQEGNNKDIKCLENVRRMTLPLGNPLIRTRRQSLALPTNPDMEIYSNSCNEIAIHNYNRKSLAELSNIEFNENRELPQNEQKLAAKRKRLSKSFGGSTEAHDHNIVDVDVRHIHKRSKLMDETNMEEDDQKSAKEIEPHKIFMQISSTPRERLDANESYNKRILKRCEEILEAGNRAKLEAKIRNKKHKTKNKIAKKSKKKTAFAPSEETDSVANEVLRSIPIEIKRKDKNETGISQALVSMDVILNKSKLPNLSKARCVEKSLGPRFTRSIRESDPLKRKRGKQNIQQKEKCENVCATSSAGNFLELPGTPEKKKKIKYIKLATGKISVEPITPKRNCHVAFNESPITPYDVGFKVEKINLQEDMSPSAIIKAGKRKRHQDESRKNITKPGAQWTQSGLFKEEVILNRNIASMGTKSQEGKQCKVPHNFKENALSRPDINRSTKRELLMIKERNRVAQ